MLKLPNKRKTCLFFRRLKSTFKTFSIPKLPSLPAFSLPQVKLPKFPAKFTSSKESDKKRQHIFTVTKAAKFLGVTAGTLRNWERAGKLIPARTKGGSRRYRLKQLNKVLTKRNPYLASIAGQSDKLKTHNWDQYISNYKDRLHRIFVPHRALFVKLASASILAFSVAGMIFGFSRLPGNSGLYFERSDKQGSALSAGSYSAPATERELKLANTTSDSRVLQAATSFRAVDINAQTNINGTLTVNGNMVFSGEITGKVVQSIGGQTGALTLEEGTGIEIEGLEISVSANLNDIRTLGGCTACIKDADLIDDITISSSGKVAIGALDGTLTIGKGGTGLTSYTTGNLIYASATDTLAKLAIGSSGQVLTISSGIPTWSTISATGVTADSLDFSEFSDTMTLDASTSIAFGASTYGLTFTNNGTGNHTINLSSTGDFVVQDNGTAALTVNDSGNTILAGTLQVQSSTTIYSGTGAPSDASGSNGDYFFRTDGTTGNTSLYYKVSGAWISAGGGSLQNAYIVGTAIDVTTGYGALDFDLQTANFDIEVGAGTDTGDFRIWDLTDNWLFIDESADTLALGAAAGSGITIGGTGITTTNSGALSVTQTLAVTGISTLTGNLNANGGLDIDDVFVVADTTGILTTTALANLDGGIAVDTSNFTVSGTTGAVTTASTINSQTVSSAANFTGTVAIATSATITGVAEGTAALTLTAGDIVVTAGDLNLNSSTPSIITSATGTATVFNTNATTLNIGGAATTISLGAATGTTTVNNALTVTGTGTFNGTLDANGILTLGDGGDAITLSGSTYALTTTSTNTTTLADNIANAFDLQETANNYININTTNSSENISFGNATTNPSYSFLGTGAVTVAGSAEGTAALTLTAGDLVLTDGDLTVSGGETSLTSNSNTVSTLGVTNNTITTLGAGLNTTGMVDFSSTSLTTGNLLNLETTTTLTSGRMLNITSTSTALTTGNLLRLDWTPGSSTTATGDLFSLNIGANGTTTGNLFNILDSSSSIFAVSETAVTTSLPTNFTASGDVSIAYDLNMTNPTASFIKSAAPLNLVAGETFNSSDLTLQTYNMGSVVIDGVVTTSSTAATKYAQYINTGDTTATADTIYGSYITNALTGNAAKIGYGLYGTVTSSSTTADTLYGVDLATDVTGIMTTGTRNIYGLRSQPSAGAESTGGTTNVYGGYFKTTGDVAAGGTINNYGLYVANGTYDTDGTNTAYGLYVEAMSGADTNVAAYFAGNVQLVQNAVSGGATAFSLTGGAHTAMTAEVSDLAVLAHTDTITGAITTQRFNRFMLPTISAASSLTVTNAATLYVEGAPAVAASAVITNPYALWIDAGTARFDGAVAYGAQQTFVDSDATPDVSGGTNWITNTTTFTITDFDAGSGTLQAGHIIYVESAGAITYDVTTSGLEGGTTDIVTAAGDMTAWIYDGTQWKLINWVKGSLAQTGADLAELYSSDSSLEPGDVVSIPERAINCATTAGCNSELQFAPTSVVKSKTSYDRRALGIVSTKPGIILKDGSETGNTYPIALSGRVPVKVTTENGPIEPGDYLTSSSKPGIAMKMTKAGQAIGKALASFSCTSGLQSAPCQGSILAFVNLGYADPSGNKNLASGENLVTPFGRNSEFPLALNDSGEVSTPLDSSNTPVTSSNEDTSDLKERISALEQDMGNLSSITDLSFLTERVKTLEAFVLRENAEATESATATDSATPLDSSNDPLISSSSLDLTGNLTIIGKSILSDTSITGKLTVGLIEFDPLEQSINAVGILKLQNKLGGGVTIDQLGNVIIDGSLTANDLSLPKNIGEAKIPAGKTTITITNPNTKSTSAIFLSPVGANVGAYISSKNDGEFTIKIPLIAPSSGFLVQYLIINP